MKKKPMVITTIVVIAIIFVIAGWMWGKGKTDWYAWSGAFGPLNLYELDKSLTDNDISSTYDLDSMKDFRIDGQFTIKRGEVKIIVSMNDQYLFEQVFNSEVSRLESEIYTDQKGELRIDMIISEDADGEYTFTVYTRETKFRRLLEKMSRIL